jgi:hypothetical protein
MAKETLTRNKGVFKMLCNELGFEFDFSELERMKIPKLWEIEILNNDDMKQQLYEIV